MPAGAGSEDDSSKEAPMVWLLLFILIAIVFGVLGAVVKGLLWLLIIGVIVFVVAVLTAGWQMRRAGAGSRRR